GAGTRGLDRSHAYMRALVAGRSGLRARVRHAARDLHRAGSGRRLIASLDLARSSSATTAARLHFAISKSRACKRWSLHGVEASSYSIARILAPMIAWSSDQSGMGTGQV